MDRHLDVCLDAGINVEGTNAEVALVSGNFKHLQKEHNKQGMKCG